MEEAATLVVEEVEADDDVDDVDDDDALFSIFSLVLAAVVCFFSSSLAFRSWRRRSFRERTFPLAPPPPPPPCDLVVMLAKRVVLRSRALGTTGDFPALLYRRALPLFSDRHDLVWYRITRNIDSF